MWCIRFRAFFPKHFQSFFPPARAQSEIDRHEDGPVPRASGLDADAQGAPHAGDGAPSRRKRLAKGREQDPRGERAGTNRARCSFPSLAALSGTDYPSNVPRRSARGRDPGPSGHGVRGGILPAQRHRPVKVSAAPTLSCSKDDKNTLWTDSLSISRTLWFARRAGTRSSPPASSSLRRSTTRTSTRREGYASTR